MTFTEVIPTKMHQLFISPSYIPIDSSVTLINAKIIDKLDHLGVNTTVLTVSPEDTSYTVTLKLSDIFKSKRSVYRVRSYETGGKVLMALRKILRRVFPIMFFAPDYHFIWEFLAILKLFKIRKERKIDVIHSVSAPYCSHIVGYMAKTIFKRPWVCHLDDFWADQPAEHFGRYRFLNRWIEKKCFEKADVVLSTSREILTHAAARYSEAIKNKFKFIPPSYESSHYPERGFGRNGKFRFTYLGVFYPGKREPASLFDALRIIRETHPEAYHRLEIYLVGVDHPTYQSMAEGRGIADIVRCSGRVNYLESMKLMKEASVLVHIGYMSGKFSEDIHISGKLFEYLGAERLILAITTLSGPVADFIRENNGIVCDYNNPKDIADAVVKIVSDHSIDDLYNWTNPSRVETLYSSESVATGYKELFHKLICNA
jgi:glycosyltransferase involved in cell wall biosynthesis